MKVLGVNVSEKPSVALVDGTRVKLAVQSDVPRGVSWIRELSDYEVVVSTDKSVKSLAKLKRFELVDYREALATAAIATRNWDSCAVLVLDSYYTSLGYYSGKQFSWLKDFEYPNSLSLFYSAATRLLGFDSITEDNRVRALALRGNPVYSDWINSNIIQKTDSGYHIIPNLEYGVGVTTSSPDIAASVQASYTSIVLHLVDWLAKQTNLRNLVVVGRGAANYLTNSALFSSSFTDIAFSPMSGAASVSVGAACLLTGATWKNFCIGPSNPTPLDTETFSKLLLRQTVVENNQGPADFADYSYLNRAVLKIPTKEHLATLNDDSVFLCRDIDYNKYFSGSSVQTANSLVDCLVPWLPKKVKVVTVNPSLNPYLSRVLDVLKEEQQPILISEHNEI